MIFTNINNIELTPKRIEQNRKQYTTQTLFIHTQTQEQFIEHVHCLMRMCNDVFI